MPFKCIEFIYFEKLEEFQFTDQKKLDSNS